MSDRTSPDDLRGSYAGVVSRGIALVIDNLVIAVSLVAGAWLTLAIVDTILLRPIRLPQVQPVTISFIAAGYTALYYTLLWWGFGKTIGKALMGLRVTAAHGGRLTLGRSALRFVGYVLSWLTLGIGFFIAAFSAQRLDLADHLARSRVVYDWRAHTSPILPRAQVGRLRPK